MPLDQLWYLRLVRFYYSYTQGPQARAAAYRELFAPQVRRFIGLRNVSLNQVLSAVETFFRSHPNPYYSVQGEPDVSSRGEVTAVRARVSAQWDEACPSEWGREYWRCQRQQPLDLRLETDAQGKIIDFAESPAPKTRFRAVQDVSGYDVPPSVCEESGSVSVELTRGAIVEATGRIVNTSCGPCEQIREFVHGGTRFWAIPSACHREYDGQSGPHLAGEDFLVPVE
jgi:hypothetical protein